MSISIKKTAMAVACFILVGAMLGAVNPAFADWTSLGPNGGPIGCGAISSGTSPVVYAVPAGNYGLLLKTDDGGANWTTTNSTFWSSPSQLAVVPTDPNRVFAIVGSSVFRSNDGGQTWDEFNLDPVNYRVTGYDITVSPQNGQVLCVAGAHWDIVNSTWRLTCARSNDGGQTWSSVECGTWPSAFGYAVAVDPVNTSTVYVGGNSNPSGVPTPLFYKSADGGQTWISYSISSSAGTIYSLHVNPQNSDIILAGTGGGVYRSADAGANWTHCNIYGNCYRIASVPGAPNVLYTCSDNNVYRSQDAGITWSAVNSGIEGHGIKTILPQAGNTVYCGSSAGMFKSLDAGATWQLVNNGIRVGQVPVLAVSPIDHQTTYAQVLDDAIFKSADQGYTWQRQPAVLSCGNICSFCFDPTDPQRLWMLEGQG